MIKLEKRNKKCIFEYTNNSIGVKCDKMKKPMWLIIEKPKFNRSPKFKVSFSKYCYLLPTGCGHNKSVATHTFESGHGEDVYKCQHQWITFHYTYFFLWFRLDIAMWESVKGMGCELMKAFKKPSKFKDGLKIYQ